MRDNQDQEAKLDSRLNELRSLILLPEQEEIEQLQHRLDDNDIRSEEIGRVLPEAIHYSSKQDNRLSDALMPTVEKAVKSSVEKDITTFADALYPVMGPAIRRSIAETFKEMLQSLNVALENSFSWQGLKWRIESMRTGQAFSEIVMLRSLVYKVDQVFLIHRETGGLLQHVTAVDGTQDADMVSGMFTAITDFVQDSFQVEGKSSLDSIHIDDLTVIIEPGPLAIIAIVIRGSAPKNIREELRKALELIHLESRSLLVNFKGDPAPFEVSRPYLEACLKSQYKAKEQGKFLTPQIMILLVSAVMIFGGWLWFSFQYETQWNNYIEKLKQEPGIVITEVVESGDHFYIKGLRDPLAKMPQELRDESVPVAEEDISYQLEPYQALASEFVLKRAEMVLAIPEQVSLSLKDGILKAEGLASYQWQLEAQKMVRTIAGLNDYDDSALINADLNILNPPPTVTLLLKDGVLTATGHAPYQWILDVARKAKLIAGVSHYDDSKLQNDDLLALAPPNSVQLTLHDKKLMAAGNASYLWIKNTRQKVKEVSAIESYDDSQVVNNDLVDLDAPTSVNLLLTDDVLTATGRASHQWVEDTKRRVALIAGIELYDDSNLEDIEQVEMDKLIQKLEQRVILFQVYAAGQAIEQMERYAILEDIERLFQLAKVLNKQVKIGIIGRTDASGSDDKNLTLSQERANFIREYLLSKQISEANVEARGIGSSLPLGNDPTGADKVLNRSVTFEIDLAHSELIRE